MAGVAEIQGGLSDADVRLDANKGDLRGHGEAGGDGRDEHGEASLIVGGCAEQRCERGDRRAKLGYRLCSRVDRDIEGVGECEELLLGENSTHGKEKE